MFVEMKKEMLSNAGYCAMLDRAGNAQEASSSQFQNRLRLTKVVWVVEMLSTFH